MLSEIQKVPLRRVELGAEQGREQVQSEGQRMARMMVPITLVFIIPLVAWPQLARDPNGNLARVLSYVPLTTPMLMVLRLASSPDIRRGEVALSMLVLAAGVLVTIWAAAKVFRTGILLYGKRPGPREILRWLRERWSSTGSAHHYATCNIVVHDGHHRSTDTRTFLRLGALPPHPRRLSHWASSMMAGRELSLSIIGDDGLVGYSHHLCLCLAVSSDLMYFEYAAVEDRALPTGTPSATAVQWHGRCRRPEASPCLCIMLLAKSEKRQGSGDGVPGSRGFACASD